MSALYGAEQSLLHVVRRLDRNDWEPIFLLPAEGLFSAAIRAEGWEVRFFDLRRGLPGAFDLSRVIREVRADLVHLNLHFVWPIVSLACRLARTPLVIHVRNMVGGERIGPLRRHLFRRAAAIICISEAVRERLHSSGLANAELSERVSVVADGRDFSRYQAGDRARFRAEIGISPGSPLIGMVARIERMKGQDIFLAAARIVAHRVPEARFVLVGGLMREADRPYQDELERIATDPVLRDRVTILGYRDDIPHVLAALDCFVHSSRRGAFVSVLIEAMGAGVPVVASDVDGIPECVGRDGAGVLVSPIEPRAFADAIVAVITEPDRAHRIAEAGRARARRLFDAVPLARDTEMVFRGVLQQARV